MNNLRKPKWLKSNKLGRKTTIDITKDLAEFGLHSVCQEAQCPNKGECFERGTATFMILGDTCTRNCKFCAINKTTKTLPSPDPNEPEKIADLVKKMQLKYVVITTVTRDDLSDGGASQFVKTIKEIKQKNKQTAVEVLISDLNGNHADIETIVRAKPDVFNHNIETVESLYPQVRPMADYKRSLDVLLYAKEIDPDILTKSGMMVGLGETEEQVYQVMKDLRKHKVDFLTIGQYMQPSKQHYPVREYVHPHTFSAYKTKALELGFVMVESAPLVRSSYHAEKAINFIKQNVQNV